MKKVTLFFVLVSLSLHAFASEKRFIVAFANPVSNYQEIQNQISHCNGILNVSYCNETNAFVLEYNQDVYPKLEMLEIYVRPSLEKISKVKFYFIDNNSSYFNTLNCN